MEEEEDSQGKKKNEEEEKKKHQPVKKEMILERLRERNKRERDPFGHLILQSVRDLCSRMALELQEKEKEREREREEAKEREKRLEEKFLHSLVEKEVKEEEADSKERERRKELEAEIVDLKKELEENRKTLSEAYQSSYLERSALVHLQRETKEQSEQITLFKSEITTLKEKEKEQEQQISEKEKVLSFQRKEIETEKELFKSMEKQLVLRDEKTQLAEKKMRESERVLHQVERERDSFHQKIRELEREGELNAQHVSSLGEEIASLVKRERERESLREEEDFLRMRDVQKKIDQMMDEKRKADILVDCLMLQLENQNKSLVTFDRLNDSLKARIIALEKSIQCISCLLSPERERTTEEIITQNSSYQEDELPPECVPFVETASDQEPPAIVRFFSTLFGGESAPTSRSFSPHNLPSGEEQKIEGKLEQEEEKKEQVNPPISHQSLSSLKAIALQSKAASLPGSRRDSPPFDFFEIEGDDPPPKTEEDNSWSSSSLRKEFRVRSFSASPPSPPRQSSSSAPSSIPPPDPLSLSKKFNLPLASRDRSPHPLSGHSQAVTCAKFSEVGHVLISGSLDQTVKVWDTSTFREMVTLRGPTKSVLCLDISPEGLILAGGTDNAISVWNKRSRLIDTLTGHTRQIVGAAFTSPSSNIVSASTDRTLKFWRPSGIGYSGHSIYSCVCTMPGHSMPTDLCLSLVTAFTSHKDNLIREYNVEIGKEVDSISCHSSTVCSVSISADGMLLGSNSREHCIKLVDTRTRDVVMTLRDPKYRVVREQSKIDFALDRNILLSASDSGEIVEWDIRKKAIALEVLGHPKGVKKICTFVAASVGSRFASCYLGINTPFLWE